MRLPSPVESREIMTGENRQGETIESNFRFLVIEVRKQLRRTQSYLAEPTPQLHAAVVARDDYIDNLTQTIAKKIERGLALKVVPDSERKLLSAYLTAAVNLERIADHAEGTFWYVLPSLPMFLLMPWMLPPTLV